MARGGETIVEEAECAANPDGPESCQFPYYPGTVGWKFGLEKYRDSPVQDNGTQITDENQFQAWEDGTVHRTRFDLARRSLFHYILLAHARAKPKSLPCLLNVPTQTQPLLRPIPARYDVELAECTNPNTFGFVAADYHVPSSASGVADLPGGNVLITLGLWDKVMGTGTPFLQASTIVHELGHNLNLFHGAIPTIPGNKKLGTFSYSEPNCKPNYQSVMSYLFQAHGLFDVNGAPHIDLSDRVLGYPTATPLDHIVENSLLADNPLGSTPSGGVKYRPTWFAQHNPLNPTLLSTQLGVSAASRLCNGVKLTELTQAPEPDGSRLVDGERLERDGYRLEG